MVHHFAKFMASPQFSHPQICEPNCKIEHKNKKDKSESKFEKFIKGMVKK